MFTKRYYVLHSSLAVIAFTSLGLSGLTQAKADSAIPVIVMDTTNIYWQTVFAGARKAGKDLGVTVSELGPQSDLDVDGQIAILQKAAASGAPAVVIAASNFSKLGKPVDEAAKTVKIVGIDASADSKAYTSFLATDNTQGGRAAADVMAEGIKAKTGKFEGEVAVLLPAAGVGSTEHRAAGFKEELAAKYPNIKIVAEKISSDGQSASAVQMSVDLIHSNPNLKGIFATALPMAQGLGKAVADEKVGDKLTAVGFDSDKRLVKYLAGDTLYALIVQNPFRIGYEGVKTAVALSKGETVPATVDTGVTAITKAMMEQDQYKQLLSPKLD